MTRDPYPIPWNVTTVSCVVFLHDVVGGGTVHDVSWCPFPVPLLSHDTRDLQDVV